jgi:hypothetical protein
MEVLDVELWTALKNSLMLPNKKAMFRLNRISMRNTLVYMFLLLFITLIPGFVMDASTQEIVNSDSLDLYILQLVVFYPFLCIFIGISGASLIAGGGLLIKTALKRKLAYQQVWKMTVFASTLPLFGHLILNMLKIHEWTYTLILLALLYILLTLMIMNYPKRAR